MTETTGHECLYVGFPEHDNDLMYMAVGMEVGMICQRIGIDPEEVRLEQQYMAKTFFKSKPKLEVNSIVTVKFKTPEDAAAFRIAAPSGMYVTDIDEV